MVSWTLYVSVFFFHQQDWFAFLRLDNVTAGEKFFPNDGYPSAEDNYGFCQVSGSCQSAVKGNKDQTT